MDSLVLELQRDALDKGVEITFLLRKALLVSRKLKIKDIQEWIGSELNGYEYDKVPEYRKITGEIKAFNPYRGWISVDVDRTAKEIFCRRNVSLGVSQVESLIVGSSDGYFSMNYSPEQARFLMDSMGEDFKPILQAALHQLVRVIDTIRTKVLEFALDLEEKGILGEGISFSKDEQVLAQSITYNTINIHRMDNSQIQQASSESEQLQ